MSDAGNGLELMKVFQAGSYVAGNGPDPACMWSVGEDFNELVAQCGQIAASFFETKMWGTADKDATGWHGEGAMRSCLIHRRDRERGRVVCQ